MLNNKSFKAVRGKIRRALRRGETNLSPSTATCLVHDITGPHDTRVDGFGCTYACTIARRAVAMAYMVEYHKRTDWLLAHWPIYR